MSRGDGEPERMRKSSFINCAVKKRKLAWSDVFDDVGRMSLSRRLPSHCDRKLASIACSGTGVSPENNVPPSGVMCISASAGSDGKHSRMPRFMLLLRFVREQMSPTKQRLLNRDQSHRKGRRGHTRHKSRTRNLRLH